jgi:FkbM family methyltransferase
MEYTFKEIKTGINISYQNIHCFTYLNSGQLFFNLLKQQIGNYFDADRIKLNVNGLPYIECGEKEFKSIIQIPDITAAIEKSISFSEVQENYIQGIAALDNKKLLYRKNLPLEFQIVKQVFLNEEYQRRGLILNPSDVVFDLGANIGCFAISIFDKVKQVIALEPEQVNYQFLQANIYSNDCTNVISFQDAVVGDNDSKRLLYCGKVPYYYTLLPRFNRKPVEVSCVNINKLISKYKPTKLKVDIEGSEFEVLYAIKNFKSIKQIIFEMNFDMNGDLKNGFVKYHSLREHLSANGFDVTEMLEEFGKDWNHVFLVSKK